MKEAADGRLTFRGTDAVNKWTWIDTFGGKLTENITQAVARDCLAEVIRRVFINLGYPIAFHVHDEIVCEVPEEYADKSLEAISREFAKPVGWAPDLPLKGAGYITPYYKKD